MNIANAASFNPAHCELALRPQASLIGAVSTFSEEERLNALADAVSRQDTMTRKFVQPLGHGLKDRGL